MQATAVPDPPTAGTRRRRKRPVAGRFVAQSTGLQIRRAAGGPFPFHPHVGPCSDQPVLAQLAPGLQVLRQVRACGDHVLAHVIVLHVRQKLVE